jgi:hypothetical protein
MTDHDKDAEIARLTEALEQATQERDELLKQRAERRKWKYLVERTQLIAERDQQAELRAEAEAKLAGVCDDSRHLEAELDQQAGALVTLREALEKALAGIDDVAAQASLCAHHVVPHEHQRTWLRSEVRREADGAQRAIRAALAASVPASTHMKLGDFDTVCGAKKRRGNSFYEWAYVTCPECRAKGLPASTPEETK